MLTIIYIIMNPYEQYERQQEYYQYQQQRFANPIDLTSQEVSQTERVRLMAEHVFSTKDTSDLYGVICNEDMQPLDMFNMLIELLIYGMNYLNSTKTLFMMSSEFFVDHDGELSPDNDELDNVNLIDGELHDVINDIHSHLKSMGFKVDITETQSSNIKNNLYRDRDDWYYEIVPKPELECWCPPNDFYVLKYRMISNKWFNARNGNLSDYQAFFISDQKKIFVIKFDYINH
jgi:hypothetical protein